MKALILSLLAIFTASAAFAADAAPNTLTDAEKAAGWKLLFDGKDASQWWRGYKKDTLPDQWKAEDGALVRHGGGDIITKDQFESFEFSVDWKISEGGNSGVMFKVQETDGPPYKTGPEAQIQDNVKGKDPQKAGWMYQLYPASVDTTKPVGEWNTFVLKCEKTAAGTYKCEHTMNGTKYCEYELGSADWNEKVAKSKFAKWEGFGKAAKGHICLQDHGNLVSFRNIKIREIK
jgi:opacity protein-like surface antigen